MNARPGRARRRLYLKTDRRLKQTNITLHVKLDIYIVTICSIWTTTRHRIEFNMRNMNDHMLQQTNNRVCWLKSRFSDKSLLHLFDTCCYWMATPRTPFIRSSWVGVEFHSVAAGRRSRHHVIFYKGRTSTVHTRLISAGKT